MMYVKPIDISDKLRIGNIAPVDSIEMCTFDNNSSNISNSSTVATTSEKNLSQHKLAKLYNTKTNLQSKDSSIFEKYKQYSDDLGYSGTIDLKVIDWSKRISTLKSRKEFTTTMNVLNFNSIPKSVSKTLDGYSGQLTLSKVVVNSTDTVSTQYTIGELYKPYSELLISKDNLSISISKKLILDNVYIGTLTRRYSDKSIYQNQLSVVVSTIISGKVNNSFPKSITKNGVLYLPSGEYVSRTIETYKKHYGTCRYWGGGSSKPNNYYGNPDYRFRVNGWTAKGYMNGTATPTLGRYGHKIDAQFKKQPTKYPIDGPGGCHPSDHTGLKWTYDIEEASKYGASTDPYKGGAVWASDYWKKSGGVWPPPGYEKDFLGAGHFSKSNIVSGGSNPIPHTNKLCVKAGAQKTSLAGFYNAAGWYNKWFRDVVMFYKSGTTTTIQEGKYIGYTTKDNGGIVNNVSLLSGILSCKKTGTRQSTRNMNVTVTYSGILTKDTTLYDAKATYEGLVYKKVFVDTTIPAPTKTMSFIIDTDGYIKDFNGSKLFKSQFVRLTDVSKNGIPMLYKYDMKNTIRIPNGPKEMTYTETKYVALKYNVSAMDKIEYLLRLTPTGTTDIYNCTIYTDSCIGYTDKVIVEYVDEKTTINETISSEYVYTQGIDYTSSTTDNLNYSIKFADSGSTTTDTRRKIGIIYKIKTTDGLLSSNTLTCNVVNKKYALENEKIYFMHDYYNASPVIDGDRLTARDIIARDNGIDADTIINKKFYIEVSGTNIPFVDSYTDIDGNGYVYICTYEDTGFPVTVNGTTTYTGIYKQYTLAESINGIIYDGLYGVLENQVGINVLSPYDSNEFKNWYARITYYPFDIVNNRNNTNIKSEYTINEYLSDTYHSTLGKPYKSFSERAIIVNTTTIKLSRPNILFNKNHMTIYNSSKDKYIGILGFDLNESVIKLSENISLNDIVRVNYVYAETSYEYKGFSDYRLNLNPNYLHSYTDTETGTIKPSYDLFNKTIYIFLRPNKVTNVDTGEVIINNSSSYHLYHKIDDTVPAGIYDLLIGIVSVTPSSSILSTNISRSSIVGGGIKEKYIKNNLNNLDGFYDVSSYSEKAIQKNGTFVIELDDGVDKDIVKGIINKQKPVGILPVYR